VAVNNHGLYYYRGLENGKKQKETLACAALSRVIPFSDNQGLRALYLGKEHRKRKK
jgi:hypothetical protein